MCLSAGWILLRTAAAPLGGSKHDCRSCKTLPRLFERVTKQSVSISVRKLMWAVAWLRSKLIRVRQMKVFNILKPRRLEVTLELKLSNQARSSNHMRQPQRQIWLSMCLKCVTRFINVCKNIVYKLLGNSQQPAPILLGGFCRYFLLQKAICNNKRFK